MEIEQTDAGRDDRPFSLDQILRRERRQENTVYCPFSADHKQTSRIGNDDTYITLIRLNELIIVSDIFGWLDLAWALSRFGSLLV